MLASSGGDYTTAERRARSFKGREVETWSPGFPVRQLAAPFDAALRYCVPCGRAALGQAYDRAGRPDSAVAAYERYITTPDLVRLGEWRLGDDGTQLAPAHKRLGELYEQQGDRAKAKHHYSQFVELWKDCDPELKSSVVEVRRRLRHLGG